MSTFSEIVELLLRSSHTPCAAPEVDLSGLMSMSLLEWLDEQARECPIDMNCPRS